MSNPPMPPLYGQIFETIKANFKLIALFGCIITLLETLSGGTLMQLIDLFETTRDFPAAQCLLLVAAWSYIYPQTQIAAMDYHQQPPHQARTPLWISDNGFHKYFMRFSIHFLLITLLMLAVMLFFSIIFLLGSYIQKSLIIDISAILLIVSFIALIPLTATKLAAVIDPNGNTSFKASFERGKHIFWHYLGNGFMLSLALAIPMRITIIMLTALLYKIGFLSDNITMTTILAVDNIGIIPFFTLNLIQNIFTILSFVVFGVLASHYYIWSEYYLPKQE